MCIYNNIDKTNIVIKTAVMKKVCKYHKKQEQLFYINEAVPKGMCFEAFSVAYPSALALLYNANMHSGCLNNNKQLKKTGGLIFQCPSYKNKIVFYMERKEKLPIFIKKLKHAAENVFKHFFFPVDKIHLEHDVCLKVIEVDGQCPQGHKVGDEFFLNTQNTKILCPASFNSLYPFIQMLYKRIKIPWEKNKDFAFVHCPDHEGIIYKIQLACKKEQNE